MGKIYFNYIKLQPIIRFRLCIGLTIGEVTLAGPSVPVITLSGSAKLTLGGSTDTQALVLTSSGSDIYAIDIASSSASLSSIGKTVAITATATSDNAYGIFINTGMLYIDGGLSGSITATATGSGGKAYGIRAGSSGITIDSIADTGQIQVTGASEATGIIGNSTISITNAMAGSITAAATSDFAYGIRSVGANITIGSIADTGQIQVTGHNASGLDGQMGLTITNAMAGSITATATGSDGHAYGICASAHNISIGGDLSGSITATANGSDGNANAYGILASTGNISIGGDLSGSITATATNGEAYGIRAAAGKLTIAGDLSGTITATANGSYGKAYGLYVSQDGNFRGGLSGSITATATNDAAFGIYIGSTPQAWSGVISSTGSVSAISDSHAQAIFTDVNDMLSLTVYGTLSATNTSGNVFDNGYAILSGAGTDVVTLANGATIIGKIDLYDANDTLILLGTPNANTNIPSINNVETLNVGDGATATNWSLTPTSASSFTTTTISANAALAINRNVSLGLLTLDGGTLRPSENMTSSVDVELSANSGTINTNGYDMTLAGYVVGPGSLIKSGDGTLELTGSNTYSGGTVFSAGTVSVANYTALGSGSLTFAGGTLTVGGNDVLTTTLDTTTQNAVFNTTSGDITVSGSITGTGSVTKAGTGTLLLTGTNDYSGGTVFANGTVSVAAYSYLGTGGYTFAGGRLLVAGVDVSQGGQIPTDSGLIFDTSSGDQTVSSSLTGSDAVTKIGSGTLTLTGGSSSYTGTLTVSGGKIQVASGAVVGGTVSVASGGTLGGYGTVGSVTNSGTVSPGGSIGTLTIAGNYTQSATGDLLAEVSPTISDLLNVTGTASLDGTLTVAPQQGYYTSGQSWTILTAAGGVTGSFANVLTSGSWNLRFTPTYTANGVTVTVSRLSYATAALTSRAVPVALALDAAASGANGEMAQLLAGLDFSSPGAVNVAMNILCAESYDAYTQTLLEGGRSLTASQRSALAGGTATGSAAFAGAGDLGPSAVAALAGADTAANADASGGLGKQDIAPGQYAVFLRPLGLHTRQYGDADRTGYEAYTGGITGGILYKPSVDLTLGFAPAFMTQSVTLRGGSTGSGTISDWSVALLAGYRHGPLYLDGVARIGLDHFESSRTLALPGVTRTAKGSWNGWNSSLSVAGGYDFKAGEYTLGPIASLEWQYLGQDAFTESGAGTIGQRVGDRRNHSLKTVVGGRITRSFDTAAGVVTPELRLGWAAQWLDQTQGIDASFIGTPQSSYRARVSGHAYHAAVIDCGVSVAATENLSASIRAGIELFRPHHEAQAVSVGVKYSF